MSRALAIVAAFLLWTPAAPAQPADSGVTLIVVERARLTPEVVTVPADGEVRFVNRSQRAIHVQFLDASGHHHLFPVEASIGAIFHRAGRHPFVVHFRDGSGRELRGAVDVTELPRPATDLPVCGWITVEGNCIAP
jgi:hypothetical protein